MKRVVLSLILASLAGAQASPPPADPAAPPDGLKLGDVTFTGTLRSRLYIWDWFQAATGDNQYEYSGNYLRLNFAQKLTAWDWDAEFSIPFLLGLPTGATDAVTGHDLSPRDSHFVSRRVSQAER